MARLLAVHARQADQFDNGFDIEEEIAIDPAIDGFDAKQPYTLAIYGEKSSLEDVRLRVVEQFPADIYLMEASSRRRGRLKWRRVRLMTAGRLLCSR